MNKIMLIGNLTADPEQSQTPNNISVTRFSLAVSRRFASANGERETDFFPIVVWRALGENCAKYLKKGNKACIVGSLQIRSYEDKEGIRRTAVEVVADDVEFLTPKGASEGGFVDSAPAAATKAKPKKAKSIEDLEPVEDDGDLPF